MEKKKKNNLSKTKLVALSLAAIISVGISSVGASAMEASDSTTTAPSHSRSYVGENDLGINAVNAEDQIELQAERFKSLSKILNKSIYAYTRKSITINGKSLSVKAIKMNGIEYIPFRQAASAIGASYKYNSSIATAVMSLSGLSMSATNGNYVVYANDRPLFSASPTVIMNDGRMYIPAEAFAKATGMKLTASSYSVSFSGRVTPLKKAVDFYREDEVFWLARIIHAEARGEPLLGEIAVGNVVLNRVRSKEYPNTIYGVIFDKKFGVQFSPVSDGSIYNTPSYNSVLAAKICLEGFDTSEGALFFLRPETSSSSWIPNSRPYLFSIGKHDFYK